MRSLKNLPGIVEPALQRNHVATDVLVLLGTVTRPRDRHQTSIGSTTGWLLTNLRSQKVAHPQTIPTEPSPGHGRFGQAGLLRRVDDEDAG